MPPKISSLPFSPNRRSLPSLPSMMSLPSPPRMVLALLSPMRRSA
ncbi:MAG: hypothetical protein PUQ00_31095 [Nostoc sp. S13]|nr:hypothetical protein [Nostoc sp. S13]MDF5739956.1 hypothetical protein [Nostoc sp. S13]